MARPQGKIVQVHAIDPDGNIRAIECNGDDKLKVATSLDGVNIDVDGHVQVDVVTVPTTTVVSTNSDKIFSIDSPLGMEWKDPNLPAGSSELFSPTCPADTIWVVTLGQVSTTSTTATRIVLAAVFAGITLHMLDITNPEAYITYAWTGNIYGEEGNYLSAIIVDASQGDALEAKVLGYSMRLT